MQIPQPEVNDKAVNLCYACGKDNPIGLKLQFVDDGGVVKGEFTPGEFHQGWPGVTHGGILCTLLDEVGGYAAINTGINCVTAKSEIRFVSMAPAGEPIQISSHVTKKTSRLLETEATLSLKDGTIIATSSSLWYVVKKANIVD